MNNVNYRAYAKSSDILGSFQETNEDIPEELLGDETKGDQPQEGSEPEIKETIVPMVATVTGAAVLNLRSEPSTDSKVLSTLLLGDKVFVYEVLENGWSQVTVNEFEGYVLTKYLA